MAKVPDAVVDDSDVQLFNFLTLMYSTTSNEISFDLYSFHKEKT